MTVDTLTPARPTAPAEPAMPEPVVRRTLFLASTPLHSFLALGLMQGPYRGARHTLALIDQQVDAHDHLAVALGALAPSDVEVLRFPALRGFRRARRQLAVLRQLAAARAPDVLAIGNDRRLEFYAAMQGAPAARRVYIDDGLFSYLPHHDAVPRWRETVGDARRSLKYGLKVERPSFVGGSRAVQEAYVLLPDQVHEGLQGKPVHPVEAAWFATPAARAVCLRAADAAGFDAMRCRAIRLLVLLPHPRFLLGHPELGARLEVLIAAHVQRGELVALKSHPEAERLNAEMPMRLPAHGLLHVPARLPAEALAPLLVETLVVGTLTTALLSLALFGEGLAVRSLVPRAVAGVEGAYNARAQAIYASVGILPLEEGAA